jgi:hypothetical protein
METERGKMFVQRSEDVCVALLNGREVAIHRQGDVIEGRLQGGLLWCHGQSVMGARRFR